MSLKLSVYLYLICFVSACAHVSSDKGTNYVAPDWIREPSSSEYIGGVGICGTHIKGKTGQRELAVTRALEDIARQLGVKVDSVMSVKSFSSSSQASSSNIAEYSIHTVSGETVKARIVEIWNDPRTDEIYVYMRTYR